MFQRDRAAGSEAASDAVFDSRGSQREIRGPDSCTETYGPQLVRTRENFILFVLFLQFDNWFSSIEICLFQ